MQSTSPALNPDRTFDLYVYASGHHGYDRALLVPATAGKDGSGVRRPRSCPASSARSGSKGANGLIGTAAGESAGIYVKIMTMAGDLSKFGLYFTSVTRPNAHCSTAACNALPAGAPGEDRLAKYIADNLPPAVFGDFAPEEAGIIDEDTWYQQVVDLNQAYDVAVDKFVLGTAPAGHRRAARRHRPDRRGQPPDPRAADADGARRVAPTPTTTGSAGTGPRDHRVAQRSAYLQGAYHSADARLGLVRSLVGHDPDILASSDHGFAPQWLAIDAALPLKQLGLQDVEQTVATAARPRPALPAGRSPRSARPGRPRRST